MILGFHTHICTVLYFELVRQTLNFIAYYFLNASLSYYAFLFFKFFLPFWTIVETLHYPGLISRFYNELTYCLNVEPITLYLPELHFQNNSFFCVEHFTFIVLYCTMLRACSHRMCFCIPPLCFVIVFLNMLDVHLWLLAHISDYKNINSWTPNFSSPKY